MRPRPPSKQLNGFSDGLSEYERTYCGYPFATDHEGNDGSSADYTTGVRAESYGGTDRGRLHSPE